MDGDGQVTESSSTEMNGRKNSAESHSAGRLNAGDVLNSASLGQQD